ncbi:flagellar export chaperone FliS [Radiobacillus kanasensis]|uniref:flagellar export chaperone FliS n=1 Tax=Radiobacillus kanasensis TaxID=2844358 RepID=UPI001E2C099C|nr:flagellar export chaperone FliS [Radiobacillus kanasensis]UFT98540.1 flagellar export chaperone FliS [Radiobacillus kanasensis]
MQNRYQAYQNNSVTTASPGELTLMLYNGCLKFMKQAKSGIEEENYELKNTNIQRAQAIIQELMITLDQDTPIAKEMMPLYDFINRQLMEANIKNELSLLVEVEELVTQFRDTWKEVIKINRQKLYGQGVSF